MHGTIMVFMAIVPLAFAALATLLCRFKSRAGYGISARQHGELPGVRRWWVDHVLQLFYSRGAAQRMTSYSPLATSIPTNARLSG